MNFLALVSGLFGTPPDAWRGLTDANLRAEDVVKLRRSNWPHLSQEVPVSQARFLPKFRKGGGQREVGT